MAAVVKALPGRYAKFLTAAAGIGIVYAQNQFGASNQWVQLAVAVAAALGVLAVPNPPPAVVVPGVQGVHALPIIPYEGPVSEEYVAALKDALKNITPGAGAPLNVTPGSAPPASVTPPVT